MSVTDVEACRTGTCEFVRTTRAQACHRGQPAEHALDWRRRCRRFRGAPGASSKDVSRMKRPGTPLRRLISRAASIERSEKSTPVDGGAKPCPRQRVEPDVALAQVEQRRVPARRPGWVQIEVHRLGERPCARDEVLHPIELRGQVRGNARVPVGPVDVSMFVEHARSQSRPWPYNFEVLRPNSMAPGQQACSHPWLDNLIWDAAVLSGWPCCWTCCCRNRPTRCIRWFGSGRSRERCERILSAASGRGLCLRLQSWWSWSSEARVPWRGLVWLRWPPFIRLPT